MVDRFDSLWRRHFSVIAAYCFRLTGNWHDAADLAQETGLRAWRYFDGFTGDNFIGWAKRIAITTHLNRKRKAKDTVPIDERQGYEIDPLDAIVSESLYNDVMAHLKPYQKEVMRLTVEEVPDREIAELLGISYDTVKTRRSRARKELAGVL